MEQNIIKHGDNIVTITGNARCTNADCPYIKKEKLIVVTSYIRKVTT